jgi:phage terminase large subunit GpA-like protein
MVASQAPADRWWHLPSDTPENWPTGITSERRDPQTNRWVKISSAARNEAVDTAVYAWAAAHLSGSRAIGPGRRIGLQYMRAKDWERLRDTVCPVQGDLFADPQQPAAPSSAPCSNDLLDVL